MESPTKPLYGHHILKPVKTPAKLSRACRLRPYQRQALQWLMSREDAPADHLSGHGGILADDMGLGKTVQAIALILARPPPRGREAQQTLVIAPKSVLQQWADEIEKCSDGDLTTYIFHGPSRSAQSMRDKDVVITTLDTMANDWSGARTLFKQPWHRVILDEAHMIKNPKARVTKAIFDLQATNRWALTGTPLQNEIDDMWPLIRFVGVQPYSQREAWKSMVLIPHKNEDSRGFDRLAAVWDMILLRRTKDEVLQLPEKRIETIPLSFTAKERAVYDKVLVKPAPIPVLLKDLLQACDHPYLVQMTREQIAKLSVADFEDSTKTKRLIRELERVRKRNRKTKTLVFSRWTSMLDLIQLSIAKHAPTIKYVRLDGTMSLTARQRAIEQFNEKGDNTATVFLISLMAGGVGLNLTAASRVVLLEPWWNPSVEHQAIDRAHRSGQTRPVIVKRFVIRDTVEERILKLQQIKHNLFEVAMAPQAKLSHEDVTFLLGK